MSACARSFLYPRFSAFAETFAYAASPLPSSLIGGAMISRALHHSAASLGGLVQYHTISYPDKCLSIKIYSSVNSNSLRKFSTKLSSRSGTTSKSQKEKISRPIPLLHASTNERLSRPLRSTGKVNDLRSASRLVLHKSKQSLSAKHEDGPGNLQREKILRSISLLHSSTNGKLSRPLRSTGKVNDLRSTSRSVLRTSKQSSGSKSEDEPIRTLVKRTDTENSSRRESKAVKKKTQYPTKSKENTGPKSSKQDASEDTRKKGKRVMRLDPKDTTSKRFFEGYPLPGEQVVEDKDSQIGGRAQFRAITPSDKIMQYIHKHLLGRRRPSELQKAGFDLNIAPAPLDNIPYSKKGERQATQEEVFRHKLRFLAAANVASSFPPCDVPEVAFAGRSNVGKSSLINALTRQWGVARTSDKPGLTQSINFFRLGGRLCLVDLPGYGFAYAKEEKKEAWEELVREFVTTRIGLKRVYLLVDAKWGLKLGDEELIQLMEKAGTKYQIVLTKTDTVTPTDLGRRATQIQELFKVNKSLVLPLIMVSSKTGEGLEFFRGYMAKLAKASLI